ncbi:hypothetical protein IW261DRAFT_1555509 [Armillaria novae-zelandiae]|uniref:Uncharacterized protein n=1 Tax=Armillaria novae-zelandiae TaxID=153914 RepID=A0AA39PV87_9AGAR|nr:hypothetical protein IW261DRAFT_1555509 [Armillaria novae-zelandiae]
MDSQSSTSSNNSTQYAADSEQGPFNPDLAADLQSRIFVPADALLTILRLPKDWRTNAAAQWVIDAIRRDETFQATVKGYIQASNGSGELDVPPRRLYDGMLVRVLELTNADEMILSRRRSHFLEFAARDEWLDAKKGPKKPTSSKADEDAADGMDGTSDNDDDQFYEDEDEDEVAANRWRMSIKCASMAEEILSMIRAYALGLLISPRKAQILYYDRSAIVISEAFDMVDSDDQPTDTLIAMLLGFSIIPPNSGVPPIFSRAE